MARKKPTHIHTPTNGGKPKEIELSLCMIVRDEEPRLRECLESFKPHVDEIIVLDTGSKDRTCEVAAACGAEVWQMPWPDSFAIARNWSMEPARGKHILWVDADDVCPPECGPQFRELARRDPRANTAYQVLVRIPPAPGGFGEHVVDHVKLFPNRPGPRALRFEHRIHEQIIPACRDAGVEVEFSDLYVIHGNYDRSEEGQEKKRCRDFRLLELDFRDRPEHPFVLFNLGMTYLHATKDFEVAAHYLMRSLARSHPTDSIVRKTYAMLTTARTHQGEWELALAANEKGRGFYPDDAELLFQAAHIYQQTGRVADARLSLERLVSGKDDPHYRSVDVGLRTYKGWHELALLFRRLGDAPHCERVLRTIVKEDPGYLPARADLAETLDRSGRKAEARAVLETLPPAEGMKEQFTRLQSVLQAA